MQWRYLDIRRITEEEFESWYAMADEKRRQKCDACRVPEDRLCSIAGDHLARILLAQLCSVDPASIRFERTEDGKPYALGLGAHFNVSHSGHFVVCGVSDKPVGIDIEQMRPVREKLVKKVCTDAELSWYQEAESTEEATRRFFQIWTSKEAYFKWAGTGITDLKAFDTLDHIRSGGTFELEGHMVSIYE